MRGATPGTAQRAARQCIDATLYTRCVVLLQLAGCVDRVVLARLERSSRVVVCKEGSLQCG